MPCGKCGGEQWPVWIKSVAKRSSAIDGTLRPVASSWTGRDSPKAAERATGQDDSLQTLSNGFLHATGIRVAIQERCLRALNPFLRNAQLGHHAGGHDDSARTIRPLLITHRLAIDVALSQPSSAPQMQRGEVAVHPQLLLYMMVNEPSTSLRTRLPMSAHCGRFWSATKISPSSPAQNQCGQNAGTRRMSPRTIGRGDASLPQPALPAPSWTI